MASKKKRGGGSGGGGEDPPSGSAGRGRVKLKGTLKERTVRSRNIYWDGERGVPTKMLDGKGQGSISEGGGVTSGEVDLRVYEGVLFCRRRR